MSKVRFGANRHLIVRVSYYMLVLVIVINDYIYIVLPIAGRLLTDSFILHCYCSFSSYHGTESS